MMLKRDGKFLEDKEWLPLGGEPLDSFIWADWLDAINTVLNENQQ